MSTKVLLQADVKAVDTAVGEHMIEFYALAFSKSPDKQGDRISPKALDAWLAGFYGAGKPLPISFTHAAVKDTTDPFNIIGWAPADPQHVWVDDYGLRVRAYLETEINDKADQVYRLTKRGIVTGASVAYIAEQEQPQKDSSTLITQMSVLEAGPCLDPANPDAKVLNVKSDDPTRTKAVDNSAWDGNRAMGMCNSAADYRSICAAEHTIGEPDQRQHWALPHHYLGQGPNAAGVRNSLSRLPQTQNITDAERASAQRHLDAHMREINPQAAHEHDEIAYATSATVTLPLGEWTELIGAKSGRVISTKNENKIRDAIASLTDVLASLETVTEGKANSEEPQANEEEPPTDWLHKAIAAYDQ